MSEGLYFDRGDTTALITPDALRIRFQQSGFPAATLRQSEDGLDLLLGDEMTLLLSVEGDFISGIVMDVTYVDERGNKRVRLASELLQSMGWIGEE